VNQNPYQPPGAYAPSVPAAAGNRGAFVLAAIGAWFAGAYWAAITLLLVMGMAVGSSVSGMQLVLPCVLIGLYAVRGYQIWSGDPAAARRIIWLHGVGCIAALLQMTQGHGLLAFLQGFKVVVNLFGGIAAYVALKGYAESLRRA
jgi:hypothetical protein